jgi:lysophospholipase L1-like esterase
LPSRPTTQLDEARASLLKHFHWFGFGLALLFTGYVAAYLAYRTFKLTALEPRRLQAPIQWTGESDARCTALLVGDSRIADWPVEARPGWRIGRLGFAGEAAINIEPAVRDQIATAGADVVVIQAGANDATAAVFQPEPLRVETIARAARAVMAVAADARRAGTSQVIVLTIVPPIDLELWKRALMGSEQEELMMRIGNAIATKALTEGMGVLDANLLFRDAAGKLRRQFRRDGTHWSSAGYRALDAALWSEVRNCAH